MSKPIVVTSVTDASSSGAISIATLAHRCRRGAPPHQYTVPFAGTVQHGREQGRERHDVGGEEAERQPGRDRQGDAEDGEGVGGQGPGPARRQSRSQADGRSAPTSFPPWPPPVPLSDERGGGQRVSDGHGGPRPGATAAGLGFEAGGFYAKCERCGREVRAGPLGPPGAAGTLPWASGS